MAAVAMILVSCGGNTQRKTVQTTPQEPVAVKSHAVQNFRIAAGVEDGNTNWVIIVFGNLFVCLMEGLVVGIQVLRLEYYEMFSRFYKGSGRVFQPYSKKKN